MKELGALREPTGSRTTLKLKTPGRTSQKAPETPLKTRAPVKTTGPVKAAAPAKSTDWADEHKQRMQADMDALGFGIAPTERGQRR